MSVWGWIRKRLGFVDAVPAGDTSADAARPTEERGQLTPRGRGAKAKRKTSKAERTRKRKARRTASPSPEGATPPPKKKKKKRRKAKGDHRLSPGGAPIETPKVTTAAVQTEPTAAPLFAPPVFGEPEPAPEPTRQRRSTPTKPPPRPEPSPERHGAAPSNPTAAPNRTDTLSWVVVPKLQALLSAADTTLANSEATRDTLIATQKAFARDWAALRPLPREHRAQLEAERENRMRIWSGRIDALPDPKALEEAQNVAARLEIIEAAEALSDESDVDAALSKARTLNDIWRNSARVSRQSHGPLQARWRAAMDGVYARREALYAERLTKQQSLVARAELLARSTDPLRAADAMKGLQAQWKALGHAGRSDDANAAWTAFRSAADTVFQRRREAKDAAEIRNRVAKEALIAEVEGLAGSELDDVDDTLRRVHQRWRRIGHVPRADSDRLWALFRAACDRLSTPAEVDPHTLGDGRQSLAFNPFADLAAAPPSPEDA